MGTRGSLLSLISPFALVRSLSLHTDVWTWLPVTPSLKFSALSTKRNYIFYSNSSSKDPRKHSDWLLWGQPTVAKGKTSCDCYLPFHTVKVENRCSLQKVERKQTKCCLLQLNIFLCTKFSILFSRRGWSSPSGLSPFQFCEPDLGQKVEQWRWVRKVLPLKNLYPSLTGETDT